MKKKITAIALVVCLVAVAIVGGSLAYFTDTDEATNTFTVGNVDITLTEENWIGGGTVMPQVYPGEVLAKDPVVTNEGDNACFVRIKVEGLDCLDPASDIVYLTNGVKDALGAGWVLHTDNYFYYNQALAVGAETTALFDSIQIPTDLENGAPFNSFDVVVTAEAVQADGIVMEGATLTVADIVAWFNTCMA